jgi:hypothetical protein
MLHFERLKFHFRTFKRCLLLRATLFPMRLYGPAKRIAMQSAAGYSPAADVAASRLA